jgi:epoxyqueuosine reductase
MREIIQTILDQAGFTLTGFADLQTPATLVLYEQWLNENLHGEMHYLKDHLEKKAQPQNLLPMGRAAIVVAQNYFPHPRLKEKADRPSLRIAKYAQGADYHFWFKEKLEEVALRLKEQFPDEKFLCATDSSPILERDLAARAGIGWFGKNTCIINPQKGSLFFLGEILTTLKLPESPSPIADFCGTCSRCIDSCPTGALVEPRKLDATKCISYLTIESRQTPSSELRQKIGDWFFGCDICQTVCPWNQKAFGKHLSTDADTDSRERLIDDLRFFLTASGKQIEKAVAGTPLKRAGPFGLRRNALVVCAHHQIHELKEQVAKWSNDERLGELARWCLEKF